MFIMAGNSVKGFYGKCDTSTRQCYNATYLMELNVKQKSLKAFEVLQVSHL